EARPHEEPRLSLQHVPDALWPERSIPPQSTRVRPVAVTSIGGEGRAALWSIHSQLLGCAARREHRQLSPAAYERHLSLERPVERWIQRAVQHGTPILAAVGSVLVIEPAQHPVL